MECHHSGECADLSWKCISLCCTLQGTILCFMRSEIGPTHVKWNMKLVISHFDKSNHERYHEVSSYPQQTPKCRRKNYKPTGVSDCC